METPEDQNDQKGQTDNEDEQVFDCYWHVKTGFGHHYKSCRLTDCHFNIQFMIPCGIIYYKINILSLCGVGKWLTDTGILWYSQQNRPNLTIISYSSAEQRKTNSNPNVKFSVIKWPWTILFIVQSFSVLSYKLGSNELHFFDTIPTLLLQIIIPDSKSLGDFHICFYENCTVCNPVKNMDPDLRACHRPVIPDRIYTLI